MTYFQVLFYSFKSKAPLVLYSGLAFILMISGPIGCASQSAPKQAFGYQNAPPPPNEAAHRYLSSTHGSFAFETDKSEANPVTSSSFANDYMDIKTRYKVASAEHSIPEYGYAPNTYPSYNHASNGFSENSVTEGNFVDLLSYAQSKFNNSDCKKSFGLPRVKYGFGFRETARGSNIDVKGFTFSLTVPLGNKNIPKSVC